jgi:hypothetical protein
VLELTGALAGPATRRYHAPIKSEAQGVLTVRSGESRAWRAADAIDLTSHEAERDAGESRSAAARFEAAGNAGVRREPCRARGQSRAVSEPTAVSCEGGGVVG